MQPAKGAWFGRGCTQQPGVILIAKERKVLFLEDLKLLTIDYLN